MATAPKAKRPPKQTEAERLAEYVKRAVDKAPPLGPGQRARLKSILECSRKPSERVATFNRGPRLVRVDLNNVDELFTRIVKSGEQQ